jgi:hypothetical protein
MRKVLDLIWGEWEQKYFSENQKKDSTRLSTNCPTGKSRTRRSDDPPTVFSHAFFKNFVRSTTPFLVGAALDFVGVVGEVNVLDQGAALEHGGRALQLQIPGGLFRRSGLGSVAHQQ